MKYLFAFIMAFVPLISLAQYPIGVRTTNGFSTGQSVFAARVDTSFTYPSNVTAGTAGPGTLSGTSGTHLLTTTNSGFSSLHKFDDIIISGQQYQIMYVSNAKNMYVFESLVGTYSGAAWGYYQCALRLQDINFAYSGAIRNDGAIGLSTFGYGITFTGDSLNTGWRIHNLGSSDGSLRWTFYTGGLTQTPDPIYLHAQTANNDRAIELMADGSLSLPFPLTNSATDTLTVGSGLRLNKSEVIIGSSTATKYFSTNTSTFANNTTTTVTGGDVNFASVSGNLRLWDDGFGAAFGINQTAYARFGWWGLQWDFAADVCPWVDNTRAIGNATFRWAQGNVVNMTNSVTSSALFIGNAAGVTNVPAAAIVRGYVPTNFISGFQYVNGYGVPITVSATVSLTEAAVAGTSIMALEAPGNRTNQVSDVTAVTGLTGSPTRFISIVVTNGGSYWFTNQSTGGGNASSMVSGSGQIIY